MEDGKPIANLQATPVAGPCASAADARLGVPRDGEPCDSEWIEASRGGDTAAFGRLVVRYQDRLYNSLLRFTGSAEDARDIAQEAFVQAYTKLDRFRGNSAFFTWLYRIAMNRAVSASRKRRERVSLDRMHDEGRPTDPGCDAPPDARALVTEEVDAVQQAVAGLAVDYRQVLVLREFEGMDYQEIAAVVNVPVGTVRSRLFRARAQLKEALTPFIREGRALDNDT